MNDWQERLPELPQERLHRAVVREGQARRHRRAERRRNVATVLGSVAGVLLLIVAIASTATFPSGDDDDAVAPAATTAATTGDAAATTTAAPSQTTDGAAQTTVAAETTTTMPRPGGLPVTLEPEVIFEASPSGAACGAEQVQITYDHAAGGLASAVATLRVATTEVSGPMLVAGSRATVTLGPLPPGTVSSGIDAAGTVTVTGVDAAGAPFGATAELRVRACTG